MSNSERSFHSFMASAVLWHNLSIRYALALEEATLAVQRLSIDENE